jgi:hypothetical protein
MLSCQALGSLLTVLNFPSVEQVRRWRARPHEDLLAGLADDTIYDGYREETRQLIDLEELGDLALEVNGEEVNIYNEEGYRIPRRVGIVARGSSRLGMLLNLRELGQLFRPENDQALEYQLLTNANKYQVYPQAFLGSLGHFQARGVTSGFQKVLRDVNQRVGVPRSERVRVGLELFGSEPEDDEETAPPPCHSAVTGIACQGYTLDAWHDIS